MHLISQNFFNFLKDSGDDIATFISKLQSIVQQMKDLGENISDNIVITKILMSLPSEFAHFASAWESTAENLQTIENLTSRFVMEEACIGNKQKSEVDEALTAKKFRKSSKNSGTKSGTCFKCNKGGHFMRDCLTKSKKRPTAIKKNRKGQLKQH